ncbi:MAG: TetR family transcriptional regulator C-terminal domain-containing protein [Bacteroidota bacterium]
MAKTAAKQSTKANTNIREKIIDGYKEHKLMHGAQPASVFAFAKSIKIEEGQFFEHFSSFTDLESEIWEDLINKVIEAINNDENYPEFTVREKLLSFYYTMLEVLKANRSYLLMEMEDMKPGRKDQAKLKKFKTAFLDFVQGLVIEGNDTGEIPKRPFISDQYKHGFWVQLMFLMNFWKNDISKGFENTDAAVEKSVNLSLDLTEKGAIDSMIDFAKFLYQNK